MTAVTERTLVRCTCGKLSFSQAEAEDVVRRALVSRVLHGNARRAEQRSYPCDRSPGYWHVTSQKDTRPLTRPDGSLIMDYGHTDDMAAMSIITKVLAVGRDDHWEALLRPDRVKQTRRVLERVRATFNDLERSQGAGMEIAKDRKRLGEIDHWELYRVKQGYFAWKDRVAPFRAELVHRHTQAQQADLGVRRLTTDDQSASDPDLVVRVAAARARASTEARNERIEKAAEHNDRQNVIHRGLVRDLVLAVHAHQKATAAPTPADEALWAMLDALLIPAGGDMVPLAEMVENAKWRRYATKTDQSEPVTEPGES